MSITGSNRKAKVGEETLQSVKQMIRWISRQNISNPDMGFDSVFDVDQELNAYLSQGWKLSYVSFLGENPEAFGFYYCLIYETDQA